MGKFNFKEAPKAKKVQRPIPKAGVTPARVVRIVEVGNQTLSWEGQTKQVDRVIITFECVSQKFDHDGEMRPFWVSQEFTLSSHPKSNLVNFLNDIDKGDIETFDELLNEPLLLTVKHKKGADKITYANFGNATPPMEGMDVADVENDLLYFSFDEPTPETVAQLMDWEKKNKLMKANNYEGSKVQELIEGANYGDDSDDDEDQPWD